MAAAIHTGGGVSPGRLTVWSVRREIALLVLRTFASAMRINAIDATKDTSVVAGVFLTNILSFPRPDCSNKI